MGSVVLAPLAAKLERNANEDVMIKTLVQTAALGMVAQTNPRKLEMELNSLLPPDQRVQYFEG
jgi:chemotaxis protein MotA